MAFVSPLPGQKFYVLVGDGETPAEAFNFLCVATTINSKHGADVEDGMALDCADPAAMAQRVSAVKMLTWDITLSGLCDPGKAPYQRLKSCYRAGSSVNIQLKVDLAGAGGGDVEKGAFIVASWEESKADNGLVKMSFELKSTGAPTVTVNA
jgi:hypothetical protein